MPKKSVEEVAKMLASEHANDDPDIKQVFWLQHDDEIRLIEVTEAVPKQGEILPFRFTEDAPDIPYKSLVVLIHPDDWKRRMQLDWPGELDPSKNALTQLQPTGSHGDAG